MSSLATIVTLSIVLWYCIDRFKEVWAPLKFHQYITVAISAIGSFCLVFSFDLDLLNALGVIEQSSLAGEIITGLVLMSGSSGVSEVMELIKATGSVESK